MEAAHKIRNYSASEIRFVRGEEGYIGKGSYGTVQLAYHKIHQWVAVKCFKVNPTDQGRLERKLYDEVGPVQEANNPNVLRVFGVIKSPQILGMVTEYLPGNCLSNLVFNTEIAISSLLYLRFCRDISNGVVGIHNLQQEKRLTHGDLKLDNILLTSNLKCKICDFGSSELAQNTGRNSTSDRMGRNDFTEVYAAPERLMNQYIKMTTAMDVFSVAMIFYYILCREHYKSDIYSMILQQGRRPTMGKINSLKQALQNDPTGLNIIGPIESEMKKCWAQNPLDRPKILQVRDNLQNQLDLYSDACLLECVKATLEQYRIPRPIYANQQWMTIEDLDMNPQGVDESNATQDRTDSIDLAPPSSASINGQSDFQNTTAPKAVLQNFSQENENIEDLPSNDPDPNDTTAPKVVRHTSAFAYERSTGQNSSDQTPDFETAMLLAQMAISLSVSNNNQNLSKERKVWGEISKFLKAATNLVQSSDNQDPQILNSVNTLLEQVQTLIQFNVRIQTLLKAKLSCFLADCYLHWREFDEALKTATKAISLLHIFGDQSEKLSLLPCCYHITGRAYVGLGQSEEAEQVFSTAISLVQQSGDFEDNGAQKFNTLQALQLLLNMC